MPGATGTTDSVTQTSFVALISIRPPGDVQRRHGAPVTPIVRPRPSESRLQRAGTAGISSSFSSQRSSGRSPCKLGQRHLRSAEGEFQADHRQGARSKTISTPTTFIRYTTIPVSELPYPEGLGKHPYRTLGIYMKALLGDGYDNSAVHKREFWTPRYQELIRDHLAPYLDRHGDVVEIAAQALATARVSNVFDVPMPACGPDWPCQRYYGGLPPRPDPAGTVDIWTRHPPRLECDGTSVSIGDGRHRLSYLRSRIEPIDPDFPVLVEIITS